MSYVKAFMSEDDEWEESDVCYCGAEMESHSINDNHAATPMSRRVKKQTKEPTDVL